ncbi:MAG: YceI family protein [Cyclobacteriaceae bacterium]
MRIYYFLTILTILLSGSTLFSQVYTTQNGKAKFEASMPLNSYTGESDQLKGKINIETRAVEFRVPVKSIKTGIDKRDEHMYELLKGEENPEVTFKGKLQGKFDLQMGKQTVKVKGRFTLAGSTRQVTIEGTLKPVENGLHLSASWSLMITDYGLERPSITFVKVDDKHDLNIYVLLKKKQE